MSARVVLYLAMPLALVAIATIFTLRGKTARRLSHMVSDAILAIVVVVCTFGKIFIMVQFVAMVASAIITRAPVAKRSTLMVYRMRLVSNIVFFAILATIAMVFVAIAAPLLIINVVHVVRVYSILAVFAHFAFGFGNTICTLAINIAAEAQVFAIVVYAVEMIEVWRNKTFVVFDPGQPRALPFAVVTLRVTIALQQLGKAVFVAIDAAVQHLSRVA